MRVNGTVVREPGTRVEPERDQVLVHGRPIPGRSTLRYFMLHKPVGFITTLDDPEGRHTVRELIPPSPRLFPVGRLDADSSGLLLLTNDGDLAHHLMHPRYGVSKLYRVTLSSPPDAETLRRLRAGVEIEPGRSSAPAEVRVQSSRPDRVAIEVRIQEGRYREVRRMCEAVGLAVKKLHRFGYGPLRLDKLPRGACRELAAVEVQRLRVAAARPGGTAPPPTPVAERPRPRPTTDATARAGKPRRRLEVPPRRAVGRSPEARPGRAGGKGPDSRAGRGFAGRPDSPRGRRFVRGGPREEGRAQGKWPDSRPRRGFSGRPGSPPLRRGKGPPREAGIAAGKWPDSRPRRGFTGRPGSPPLRRGKGPPREAGIAAGKWPDSRPRRPFAPRSPEGGRPPRHGGKGPRPGGKSASRGRLSSGRPGSPVDRSSPSAYRMNRRGSDWNRPQAGSRRVGKRPGSGRGRSGPARPARAGRPRPNRRPRGG